MLSSDAAADEQKALRLIGTFLPRVRLRIRDGAHAAGRPSKHDVVVVVVMIIQSLIFFGKFELN